MAKQNDARFFIQLFLFFIGAEIILYTLIVYLDLLSLKSDFAKRDPAFMVFYCLSAFVFFFCIRKLDKK